MLTKEQDKKLNEMVKNYRITMFIKHKVSPSVLSGWASRYRIAMGRVLQNRDKH